MDTRHKLIRLALAAALAVVLLPSAAGADGPAYKIVVHAKHPDTSIDRRVVKQLFLKRRLTWDDGTSVHAVDLPPSSPARSTFSSELLKMKVDQVVSYWRKQVFSGGGTPPPTKSGDAAVVEFVASHPGAIGYVSSGADTSKLKVLAVE